MSFTALLWITLYCAAIVLSFSNPLFAALGYLLEYYMRPELKWWGDQLPSLRWNLIISLVLGGTFLLRRSSLPELSPVPNPALRWLLAMLAVMLVVSRTVAVSPEISLDWTVQWLKMAIIFPLLMVGVLRARSGFDLFVAAHMLGAFWWGYVAWDDPKRQAGRLVSIGSGDTLNDNSAAAHLLTVLPFAVIYLMTAKEKWLRGVALLSTVFVVNTLILCNSRGSMVALTAALGASLLLVRSGYRLRLVGAAIGMIALVLSMADTQFLTRQQTTTNYKEDGSSQQRLITWQGAFRMIQDRPFGSGGRGFHLLSPIYIPEIVAVHGGDLRAPHNTFAMVAAEWGIPGLICFAGIFASAFLMLRRIKRRDLARAESFFYWRALAVQLALIGALVASAFTDRFYGEAGYWMVSLAYVLYRLQHTELAQAPSAQERATAAQAVPVPGGVLPVGAHAYGVR